MGFLFSSLRSASSKSTTASNNMGSGPLQSRDEDAVRDLVHELANLSKRDFWNTLQKAHALRILRQQGANSDDEDVTQRLELEDVSLLVEKTANVLGPLPTRSRTCHERRRVSIGLINRLKNAENSLPKTIKTTATPGVAEHRGENKYGGTVVGENGTSIANGSDHETDGGISLTVSDRQPIHIGGQGSGCLDTLPSMPTVQVNALILQTESAILPVTPSDCAVGRMRQSGSCEMSVSPIGTDDTQSLKSAEPLIRYNRDELLMVAKGVAKSTVASTTSSGMAPPTFGARSTDEAPSASSFDTAEWISARDIDRGKIPCPVRNQQQENIKSCVKNSPVKGQERSDIAREPHSHLNPQASPFVFSIFNPLAKPFTPASVKNKATSEATAYSPDSLDAFEKWMLRSDKPNSSLAPHEEWKDH